MTPIPIANEWPEDEIPLPYLDYSGGVRNTTISSPRDSLAIARRSRYTKSYVGITVNWNLTVEQFDAFQAFWLDDLGNGIASFAMEVRYPMNSVLTEWVCKFTSPNYRATWIEGLFQVEASLDLVGPVGTDDPAPPDEVGSLHVINDSTGGGDPLEYVTPDDFVIMVLP